MTREQGHGEDRDDAHPLVRAEPLGRAEQICRLTVDGMLPTEGAPELEADPAWAIKAVLAQKKVCVKEIHTQTTVVRQVA